MVIMILSFTQNSIYLVPVQFDNVLLITPAAEGHYL